jgi:hypothetical protein
MINMITIDYEEDDQIWRPLSTTFYHFNHKYNNYNKIENFEKLCKLPRQKFEIT